MALLDALAALNAGDAGDAAACTAIALGLLRQVPGVKEELGKLLDELATSERPS